MADNNDMTSIPENNTNPESGRQFSKHVDHAIKKCGKLTDILEFPRFLQALKHTALEFKYKKLLKGLYNMSVCVLPDEEEAFLCSVLGDTLAETDFFDYVIEMQFLFLDETVKSASLYTIVKLNEEATKNLNLLKTSIFNQAGLIRLISGAPVHKQNYVDKFKKLYSMSRRFSDVFTYDWLMEHAYMNIAKDPIFKDFVIEFEKKHDLGIRYKTVSDETVKLVENAIHSSAHLAFNEFAEIVDIIPDFYETTGVAIKSDTVETSDEDPATPKLYEDSLNYSSENTNETDNVPKLKNNEVDEKIGLLMRFMELSLRSQSEKEYQAETSPQIIKNSNASEFLFQVPAKSTSQFQTAAYTETATEHEINKSETFTFPATKPSSGSSIGSSMGSSIDSGSSDSEVTRTPVAKSFQDIISRNNKPFPFATTTESGQKSYTFSFAQPATVNLGSSIVPFNPEPCKEALTSNLVDGVYNSISAMPNYRNFSFEEIRLQDYLMHKKYGNESLK